MQILISLLGPHPLIGYNPDDPIDEGNLPWMPMRSTYLQVGPLGLVTAPGELHPELWVGGYDGSWSWGNTMFDTTKLMRCLVIAMVLISLVVVGCGSSTNTGGDNDCGGPDEDGDGIGDACDRCPIAPPPAVPDSDNDEVDSPCDPDPSEDGDQIVVFDGFNDGLPTGWKASAGWTFENGEAIATPADPVVEERLLAPLPLVSQHVAVLARYEIDSVLAGATAPFSGVTAVDERPAGGSEVRCGGSRTGAADRLLLDGDVGVASDDFTTSLFR